MGFSCGMHHDKGERMVVVRFTPQAAKAVEACKSEFTPQTAKAVEACKSAGGDGRGLEVTFQYREGDNPAHAMLATIEHGIETLKQVL